MNSHTVKLYSNGVNRSDPWSLETFHLILNFGYNRYSKTLDFKGSALIVCYWHNPLLPHVHFGNSHYSAGNKIIVILIAKFSQDKNNPNDPARNSPGGNFVSHFSEKCVEIDTYFLILQLAKK